MPSRVVGDTRGMATQETADAAARPDPGPTAAPVGAPARGCCSSLPGSGVLGYVGWQFWGTTWLSPGTQERIVTDVEEDWATRAAAPGDGTPTRGRGARG